VSALIEIILPVFLVMGFGFAAVKRGLFSLDGVDALMRFSQGFAIPLLLFRAISTLDLGRGYDAGLMLSYYSGSLAGFLFGMLGARFLFGRAWDVAVAVGFSALFANSVLLGLPISELAFGADALAPNYAIISVHAAFCYFLGISTMELVRGSGGGARAAALAVLKAMFRNTLMLAILLGFAVNLSGLTLPGAVADAFDLVVRAALPTALFALGGILTRYRPEGDMRLVLWVCALSLLLHPLIVLGVGTRLAALPAEMLKPAVLTAAMAPGFNAYIFANIYGVGKRIAATSVLVGTALSVFSIWFWLWVLG